MIKILHSADWHLGAPLLRHDALKDMLMQIPERVVALCKQEKCDPSFHDFLFFLAIYLLLCYSISSKSFTLK